MRQSDREMERQKQSESKRVTYDWQVPSPKESAKAPKMGVCMCVRERASVRACVVACLQDGKMGVCMCARVCGCMLAG